MKTNSEVDYEIYSRYNTEYIRVSDYLGYEEPLKVKHNLCNNIYEVNTYHGFIRPNTTGQCPFCFSTKNAKQEHFQFKIDKRWGKSVFTVLEFTSMSKTSEVFHSVCKNTLSVKPTMFLKYKNGCIYCAGKYNFTHPEIVNEIYSVTNGEYLILPNSPKYNNEKTKLLFKHTTCGHIWKTTRKNFIGNNTRCPSCFSMSNRSKIEEYILNILNNQGVKYDTNISFVDCKAKRNYLVFDFYLEEMDIIIEFDGKQHFFNRSSNNSTKYITQIKNDQIKNKWAKNYDIQFIRIPYDITKPDIKIIVSELINSKKLSSTTIEKYNLYYQSSERIIYNEKEYYLMRNAELHKYIE